YDRWPLRSRRYGYHVGAGDYAGLPAGTAIFLVYSGLAGLGGTDNGHACGGRFLSLDAGRVRRLLGIPGRLVELVGVVSSWRSVRGALHRLPGLLHPQNDLVGTLPDIRGDHHAAGVGQRKRDPDGWSGGYRTGDLHLYSCDGDDCARTDPLAFQS